MSDSQNQPTKPNRATTLALLATMGDTTLRMLVPSAVLVAGGIYADTHWGTRPWLTIIGVVAGLVISSLLITHLVRKSQ